MVAHQKLLVGLIVFLFAAGAIALLVFADNDQTMSLSQVPSAVRTTIEKQAAGAEIQEIELEEEDGKQVYEVEIIKDGKEVDLLVAPDGTFLGYEDEDEADDDEHEVDDDDDDEDEDEVEVSLSEVPAAVRVTIEQQAPGAEVKEIELENENGKQVYEAEVIKDGKEVEFKVAPDGTFLGYEDEDDDDEDEDEDEAVVPFDSLPDAVKATAARLLGSEGELKAEKEIEDGVAQYEVEVEKNGLEQSVELTENGDVIELETEIPAAQLPPAVLSAIKSKYPNATIKEAESVQKFVYEVELVENGKTQEISILPDGKMKCCEHED